ncbi:hypothetical protein HMPREF0494_0814 [Limosilactobacillus antri DSM 16041]|uniref:Uncharacterized protein n=1 Tax=Limosilactobacillus antri DSM 16041 TaxID=525309 RepID=C8P670_9LACO|nr:hypothetical protein HMPREF0494_0814 [Limosilactobacillus antri DSM 16041]
MGEAPPNKLDPVCKGLADIYHLNDVMKKLLIRILAGHGTRLLKLI